MGTIWGGLTKISGVNKNLILIEHSHMGSFLFCFFANALHPCFRLLLCALSYSAIFVPKRSSLVNVWQPLSHF